jgi:hypothetical protein
MKKTILIIIINLIFILLPISVIYNKPDFFPAFDMRSKLLRDTFKKEKNLESYSSYVKIIKERMSQFKPVWFKGNKIIAYFGIYWLLINIFLSLTLKQKTKGKIRPLNNQRQLAKK